MTVEAFWDDWKRLTRFFHSARIALKREETIWGTVQVSDRESLEVTYSDGTRAYRAYLDDHLAAVRDEHMLCALVLFNSYALVEAYARDEMGSQVGGGIEAWSQALLTPRGRDLGDVLDGQAGLIELAVARNSVAHGFVINQGVLNRFAAAHETCPWPLNHQIVLDFTGTYVYRSRLKSLMRHLTQ